MTSKKSTKANLERNKSTFFLLGVAVTLSFVLISFEWSTEERKANAFLDDGVELIEEELIPNTLEDEPIPPAPPQIVIPEFFEIVDNTVDVGDMGKLFSDETTTDETILPYYFVRKGDAEKVEDEPFIVVEEMPRFKGGDTNKFTKWVNDRIKYPQIPQENGVQGKVIVAFVVEPDGSLSNFVVTRKIDPMLDAEALRVIQSSPEWTPGKQRGVPVRVRCSIAINYKIQ
jgi:periplasmic protein TonB